MKLLRDAFWNIVQYFTYGLGFGLGLGVVYLVVREL